MTITWSRCLLKLLKNGNGIKAFLSQTCPIWQAAMSVFSSWRDYHDAAAVRYWHGRRTAPTLR
jgi:hypothetical protein